MKRNEGSKHVREKNDLLRRIRGMNRIRRYVFQQPEDQHITGSANAELRGRTQGTIEIEQSIGCGPSEFPSSDGTSIVLVPPLIHMKKRTTSSVASRSRICYCLSDIRATTDSAVPIPHICWRMDVVSTLVGRNPKLPENSHRIVWCPWNISSKKRNG